MKIVRPQGSRQCQGDSVFQTQKGGCADEFRDCDSMSEFKLDKIPA